jgi:hypothetical protein
MLQILQNEFNFINGLKLAYDKDDNLSVSFNYATARIKQLLTTEGNILEVYVYLKCLKSGLFDDVTTSYEINWDGTEIKSEFDIIITKGFSSLMIEAKARGKIEQEFYFKLHSLADQFGTNAKTVLIADTIEQYHSDNIENNNMQRLRGTCLDIVTISDRDDIDNIDLVFAKMLNVKLPQKVVAPAAVNTSPTQTPATSRSAPPQQPQTLHTISISLEDKIWELINQKLLEHSPVSILNNHGITTIAQFLEQPEDKLMEIKNAKGISYGDRCIQVQKRLKKLLGK